MVLLKQMHDDMLARQKETDNRRKLRLEEERTYREREQAQKSPEDAFFESCALRVKQLPSHIRSIIQVQVQQLLYNAENPHLPPSSPGAIATPLCPISTRECSSLGHKYTDAHAWITTKNLPNSGECHIVWHL